MSQVFPTTVGKRVGSIATLMGALTLNAFTYSKNGNSESGFPASSVFVAAADALAAWRNVRRLATAAAWVALMAVLLRWRRAPPVSAAVWAVPSRRASASFQRAPFPG